MLRMVTVLTAVLLAASLHANGSAKDGLASNPCLSPITMHNPIYIAAGLSNDQFKVNLSIKYDLIFPLKIGFYASYTETMWWDLHSVSGPFTEIEHNPEIFWRFESGYNFLGDVKLFLLDFIQLGFFDHKSNGKDGVNSRSYNRSYAQIQISLGDTFRIGLNTKLVYFWPDSQLEDNPNYDQYAGFGSASFFVQTRDQSDLGTALENASVEIGFGEPLNNNVLRYIKAEIMSRKLLFDFRLYVQGYYGYAENMMVYDVPDEWSVRAGVILGSF